MEGHMVIQSNLERKKLHRTSQCYNSHGGSFKAVLIHVNGTSGISLIKQNNLSFSSIEINKSLPAPQCTVSLRSDSISEANCSRCHRSDVLSSLEKRAVSSTQISILQIKSSRRSLMYSRRNVGSGMEPFRIPALTRYS